MSKKIRIGYTLGDLGGIGPEIFEKFKTSFDHSLAEIVLLDDALERPSVRIGEPSKESGKHAYQVLVKACEMFQKSEIDYLVTGPVSKESFAMAGYPFKGQTEALAHICRAEVEMFFVLSSESKKTYRVVLASRHEPLSEVPHILKHRLEKSLNNSIQALEKYLKIKNPRIAVSALNPHAGEGGILGHDEELYLKPQIQKARSKYPLASIEGPFPADYIFMRLIKQYLGGETADYDLYVALYHDQILPIVKGLGGYGAVNLTLGLPFVRVSVDHGTAFDIAGKGIADESALVSCTNFILSIV